MMFHLDPNRRRLLALMLLAAVLVVAGCSSDDDTRGSTVVLQIEATLANPDKAALTIENPSRLSGRAQIRSIPAGLPGGCVDVCSPECFDQGELISDATLAVEIESTDPLVLVIIGEVSFNLGPAGSRYRLDLALSELGDSVTGVFAGDLALDSGLDATIESLTIGEQLAGQRLASVEICLSTDIVELEDDGCVGAEDGIEATYDRLANSLLIAYERGDVEIDGSDADNVLVEFQAGLVPVPIYTGCAEIEGITVGNDAPVEVAIEMQETGTGPGFAGEQLQGTIFVGLMHDSGRLETSETGRFTVTRTP